MGNIIIFGDMCTFTFSFQTCLSVIRTILQYKIKPPLPGISTMCFPLRLLQLWSIFLSKDSQYLLCLNMFNVFYKSGGFVFRENSSSFLRGNLFRYKRTCSLLRICMPGTPLCWRREREACRRAMRAKWDAVAVHCVRLAIFQPS